MRPGRELNTRIATEVLGFKVARHKGVLTEFRPNGDRPLRDYSNEMEYAFEVAKKMKVVLIPIVGEQWFAFIRSPEFDGWESPQAVLQFLEAGKFSTSGAAADENPALAICIAALKCVEKARLLQENPSLAADIAQSSESTETSEPNKTLDDSTEAPVSGDQTVVH